MVGLFEYSFQNTKYFCCLTTLSILSTKSEPFKKAPNYSIEEEISKEVVLVEEPSEPREDENGTDTPPKIDPQPLQLKDRQKRVSGLSLSSLKAKKEHQAVKHPKTAEEDLPQQPFTEEEMQQHWEALVNKIDAQGKKILASNLQSDIPRLKNDHIIWIELPNTTMKKEVEREQTVVVNYLKEKLQNYGIELQITVNEETMKKFAFTPEEKYQKLKEKNPAIDLLRKEFDLDF